MRQIEFIPFLIFSAYTGVDSALDELDFEKLLQSLKERDIKHLELEGTYKGKFEQSVLVHAKYIEDAKELARQYTQETILHVDKHREAYLLDINTGISKHIGTWTSVSEEEAQKRDTWMYDADTDQFYTVK